MEDDALSRDAGPVVRCFEKQPESMDVNSGSRLESNFEVVNLLTCVHAHAAIGGDGFAIAAA